MQKVWFDKPGPFVTNIPEEIKTTLTPTPGILHLVMKIPREDKPGEFATLYVPILGTVASKLLAILQKHEQKGHLAVSPNLGGPGRIQ